MYIYVLYRVWELVFEKFQKNYKLTDVSLWRRRVIYQLLYRSWPYKSYFFLNSDNIDILEYTFVSPFLQFRLNFYLHVNIKIILMD